jgi:Alw26I/Eco31I/Esp3I family type II restriction m6 adenine DNA methyltransferase
MIRRFGIAEAPTQYIDRAGPRVPKSADSWRLAWRDVSRPSQKRRVQAALIPPGWVSGNSLNVACFRNGELQRLKALLAVMNSLVFEFQVRAYLATAHISLGTVRKVRVPDLADRLLVNKLAALADNCLEHQPCSDMAFEKTIAEVYGLKAIEFELLTSFFKTN